MVVFHGAFRPEVLTRWEPKHTELLLRSGAHVPLKSLSFEEFELYVDDDYFCKKFSGLLITIRTKWRPKGQIFLPNLPKLRGTPFWWFDPIRRFRSILRLRRGAGGGCLERQVNHKTVVPKREACSGKNGRLG